MSVLQPGEYELKRFKPQADYLLQNQLDPIPFPTGTFIFWNAALEK